MRAVWHDVAIAGCSGKKIDVLSEVVSEDREQKRTRGEAGLSGRGARRIGIFALKVHARTVRVRDLKIAPSSTDSRCLRRSNAITPSRPRKAYPDIVVVAHASVGIEW